MRIERRACAKINLDLRVTAVRSDGYHDLATVFQTISLADTLCFERIDDDEALTLHCDDLRVPTDERNLVWRAAAAMWGVAGREGRPRGVRLTLSKAIPPGGGLGGGSADAAVTLGALAALWDVALDAAAWHRLAAQIGADVPFFLTGGTARGLGRGDEIEPWPDVPPADIVLVLPGFGVSTAAAYAWYDEGHREAPPAVGRRPVREQPPGSWYAACRNDLEGAVFERHPALARIRDVLRDAGGVPALLSGSGSAVFGLFGDRVGADIAASRLELGKLRVQRARTVTRADYRRMAFGSGDDQSSLPTASAIV